MRYFLCLLMISIPAYAEIYKWVDEKGKVHFGDKVPEQYQEKADNVDLDIRQPTEEEIAEAQARNERLRQSRERMESTKPSKRSTRGSSVVTPSRPAAGDYDQQMAEYRKSQACYAACAVNMPTGPSTRKTPQGVSYQTGGGSYRDLSNCGHCENMKKPQR